MGKNKKTGRMITVLSIMFITAFALYYYMVNKAGGKDTEIETTAVQDVLLKNLDSDYPSTVREVMKYYNEIMKCYYNEEYTEDELTMLAERALELYDDELVNLQDETQYIENLKAEITNYKESGTVISTAALSSSTDVDYFTRGGRECAKIRCIYTLRQGTRLQTIKEEYVLRKDDGSHWKILGWTAADDRDGAELKEAGKDEQAGGNE